MRKGVQVERLIAESGKIEFTEDQGVVAIDFVNMGTATVLTGMNNDNPFVELATNQTGGYSIGEGRVYESGFVKVDFSATGTKKVAAIITFDRGESDKVC